MMVARVMAALGSAMMMPTAMALATSLAPVKHRGKAISVVTTGMTMATVLAVPLGSVMGERYGYHTLFWAMAVAAVLVLCGIVLGIRAREAQPAQQVPTIRTLVAGLANRQVALTLLITVVIFVAGTSVISYLSAVVQQAGLHEYFSWILLIFGVGSLLGGVLGGWLTVVLPTFGWPAGQCLPLRWRLLCLVWRLGCQVRLGSLVAVCYYGQLVLGLPRLLSNTALLRLLQNGLS